MSAHCLRLHCLRLAFAVAFITIAGLCLASEPSRIATGPVPWQSMAGGLPEYRLRIDDQIEFVYRLANEEPSRDYQLEVGDVLRIESLVDDKLNRNLTVQSDGTIDLLLLGPVRIVRQTVAEVQSELNERYKKYYKLTDINLTRIMTHSRAASVLHAVKLTSGGQGKLVRVAPDGTIALPAIGALPALGLSLAEIEREATERYRQIAPGLVISAGLAQRAPRFVYVVGEVRNPGRFELTGATSVMQSIALAGGWSCGSQPGCVAVLRRDEAGQLLATRLDVRGTLSGECPSFAHEFWVCDADVVVVAPIQHVRRAGDFFKLCLPRGASCTSPAGCSDSLYGPSILTSLP